MLDTGTLFAFSVSLAALLAGALLWAWKLGAKLPGTGYWALGGALVLGGVLGYALGYPTASTPINFVSNLLNLAGMGALLVGSGVVLGRRPDHAWAACAIAAGTGLLAAGAWLVPSYAFRVVSYSACALAIWGRIAFVFARSDGRTLVPIRWASVGCAVAIAGCYAARAAWAVYGAPARSPGESATDRWLLFFLVSMYLAFGLSQLQLVFSLFRLDIERAMEEKNLLYREMNHRVKNSLALVTSMIALEKARIVDPDTLAACEELSGRISAVARLHDILHRGGAVREARLLPYLEAIVASVEGMAPGIELRSGGEEASLPLDRAVPFGIIANELVTNAVKHGIPAGRKGRVDALLTRRAGLIELVVEDRVLGPEGRAELATGAAAQVDFGLGGGQGRLILEALVGQLGAKLEYERSLEGGILARLRVPES